MFRFLTSRRGNAKTGILLEAWQPKQGHPKGGMNESIKTSMRLPSLRMSLHHKYIMQLISISLLIQLENLPKWRVPKRPQRNRDVLLAQALPPGIS